MADDEVADAERRVGDEAERDRRRWCRDVDPAEDLEAEQRRSA